ncbi:DinB family protein [Flavihumibacter sp. R14]|nr:DinB family protein [Flavihumibacter soli]
MKRTEWFERKFSPITDSGLLPGIIERLAGTPLRLEAKVRKITPALLEQRSGTKWSVKKEIGHLNDLEPLWLGRVTQIQAGIPELTAADLTNRKTHEADHDDRLLVDLLLDFSTSRDKLITKLKSLRDDDLKKASVHPRLKTPMTITELAYFVAEHDDHHLAQISSLSEEFDKGN